MSAVAGLVQHLLPVDPGAIESAIEDVPEPDLIAALAASFAVAAQRCLPRMNAEQRLGFCRRVADRCGEDAQAWMVEAALRSVEGDHDALAGIEGDPMVEIQSSGLTVLSAEYLTRAECPQLRDEAVEAAMALRTRMATIAERR